MEVRLAEPYPLSDPNLVARYFRGIAYREQKKEAQNSLPGLVSLPDVPVRSSKCLLGPGEFTLGEAIVPQDYFKPLEKLGLINRCETPIFLKYLMDQEYFSVKSKWAQAGVNLQPNFKVNGSYFDAPISIDNNTFRLEVILSNLTPSNEYVLPEDPFLLFRFFVPGRALKGRQLFKIAQEVGIGESVFLNIYGAKTISGRQLAEMSEYSPELNIDSPFSVDHVLLEIARQARYRDEIARVVCSDFINLSHTKRAELDQILGLSWEDGKPLPDFMRRHIVKIGESICLVMPEGFAGVLNTSLSTEELPSMVYHIASPLIDPGFGMKSPNGMPIRVERNMYGEVTDVNNFVPLALYKIFED